jgi:hypothetical protein
MSIIRELLESVNILHESKCKYSESREIDLSLGFKVSKIESKLLQKFRSYEKKDDPTNRKKKYQGAQTWIGLPPDALQTPYRDILVILDYLKDFKIKTVVDIGCAYGRFGLALQKDHIDTKFFGYEIVKKRHQEASRIIEKHNLANLEVTLCNVLNKEVKIPIAELYMIYDFSNIDDIYKIMNIISAIDSNKPRFLVIRGDRTEFLVDKFFKNIWSLLFKKTDCLLSIYQLRSSF